MTQPVSMRERMPITDRLTVHSLRMQPSPTIDSITRESSNLVGGK